MGDAERLKFRFARRCQSDGVCLVERDGRGQVRAACRRHRAIAGDFCAEAHVRAAENAQSGIDNTATVVDDVVGICRVSRRVDFVPIDFETNAIEAIGHLRNLKSRRIDDIAGTFSEVDTIAVVTRLSIGVVAAPKRERHHVAVAADDTVGHGADFEITVLSFVDIDVAVHPRARVTVFHTDIFICLCEKRLRHVLVVDVLVVGHVESRSAHRHAVQVAVVASHHSRFLVVVDGIFEIFFGATFDKQTFEHDVAIDPFGLDGVAVVCVEFVAIDDFIDILRRFVDEAVAREVVAVTNAHAVVSKAVFGVEFDGEGLSEGRFGDERSAVAVQDFAVTVVFHHAHLVGVDVQAHIDDTTAVALNRVAFVDVATRVDAVPVNLEAHPIEAQRGVCRNGEVGHVQRVAVAHGVSCTVAPRAIVLIGRVADNVAAGSRRSVGVDFVGEFAVLTVIDVGIARHPSAFVVEHRLDALTGFHGERCVHAVAIERVGGRGRRGD